jgi:hypothetical protein
MPVAPGVLGELGEDHPAVSERRAAVAHAVLAADAPALAHSRAEPPLQPEPILRIRQSGVTR